MLMRSTGRGLGRGLHGAAAVWLASLWCATLPAAQAPASLSDQKLAEVQRLVRREMAAQGIPGLSVALADRHALLWHGGFGLADLEHKTPAREQTVYRLASVSKPITAVAVLQLAQAGKLDLDAPIQRYVPAFPEKPWPVTPRQILCHTSGIRHYQSQAEVDSTRHYGTLAEALELFQRDPLLFEPGSGYSYSTYAFTLLGAVVERVSGMPFCDYLRKHVFEPAGMKHAGPDDVRVIVPQRARGYRRNDAGKVEPCALADTSNKIPGGGLLATAADMARFAVALDGGSLIRQDPLRSARTYCQTNSGKPLDRTLLWQVVPVSGTSWMFHTGKQQGASTILLTLPGRGLAVVVLTNLEDARLEQLSLNLGYLLLQP